MCHTSSRLTSPESRALTARILPFIHAPDMMISHIVITHHHHHHHHHVMRDETARILPFVHASLSR